MQAFWSTLLLGQASFLVLRLLSLAPNTVAFSTSTPTPSSTMTNSQSTAVFPRRIKGVLFDMDGTLLDSEILGCKAVYLTLENQMSEQATLGFQQRSKRMEWDLKQQTLGLPGPQWAPIVLKWATKHWGVENPPTVPEFLAKWDQIMYEHMHEVQACPGATELVQTLAHTTKLPLAIATSSHSKSVQLKRVNHEDMFQHFDTIVSADDPAVVNGKPAPDIYIEAAKRIGVAPNECIVFEDGMPGVQAGKAAGCFVVAVPDPRFTAQERLQFEQMADLVLDDLSQFDVNMLMIPSDKIQEQQQGGAQ